MDLTETEDIKRDGKNAQNYTRSAQWCDHSPRARHPRMGSQMGFRNITMNKASESDGIPAELLQILKYDGVKVLHSIDQQIWKTQQWPQD